MDRRNQPAAFWGESMNFWCRLWQIQIEHSLRFWGAMASQLPRPTAAKLAAEAESVKAIHKASRRSPRKADTASRAAAKPASKAAAQQAAAPMH